MREVVSQPVKGLLIKDYVRDEGSFTDKDGKKVEYGRGYFINILPLYSTNASDVRKYIVDENIEQSVKKQLSEVAWGSLIQLRLSGNRVTDVQVLSESIVDFEA